MPLPVVLVEIAPPNCQPELVETLLDACSAATRGADCVLADAAQGRTAWGVAIVSWRDEHETRAWIQVGRSGSGQNDWRVRVVRFDPADSRRERWRTVGFTVATLAEESDEGHGVRQGSETTEARGSAEPATSPAPTEARGPAHSNPATGTETWGHRSAPVWLDAALLMGPGLKPGPWRAGGEGRIAVVPTALPLLATGSARYAGGSAREGLSLRWFGLTVGLGGFLALPLLRLDLRGEFLFERLTVSVTEAETGARDTAHHWSTGLLGGIGAAWPANGPIAAVVGLEGWYEREPISVWVRDARVGSWPTAGWSCTLGGEWRIR